MKNDKEEWKTRGRDKEKERHSSHRNWVEVQKKNVEKVSNEQKRQGISINDERMAHFHQMPKHMT